MSLICIECKKKCNMITQGVCQPCINLKKKKQNEYEYVNIMCYVCKKEVGNILKMELYKDYYPYKTIYYDYSDTCSILKEICYECYKEQQSEYIEQYTYRMNNYLNSLKENTILDIHLKPDNYYDS